MNTVETIFTIYFIATLIIGIAVEIRWFLEATGLKQRK